MFLLFLFLELLLLLGQWAQHCSEPVWYKQNSLHVAWLWNFPAPHSCYRRLRICIELNSCLICLSSWPERRLILEKKEKYSNEQHRFSYLWTHPGFMLCCNTHPNSQFLTVHYTSKSLIQSLLFRSFKQARTDSFLSLDQLKNTAENTSIWHFHSHNSTNRTDLA